MPSTEKLDVRTYAYPMETLDSQEAVKTVSAVDLNGPKRTVACLLNSCIQTSSRSLLYLSSREQFSRTPAHSSIVRVLNSSECCAP